MSNFPKWLSLRQRRAMDWLCSCHAPAGCPGSEMANAKGMLTDSQKDIGRDAHRRRKRWLRFRLRLRQRRRRRRGRAVAKALPLPVTDWLTLDCLHHKQFGRQTHPSTHPVAGSWARNSRNPRIRHQKQGQSRKPVRSDALPRLRALLAPASFVCRAELHRQLIKLN